MKYRILQSLITLVFNSTFGLSKSEPSIKNELLPVGKTGGNSLILKNLDLINHLKHLFLLEIHQILIILFGAFPFRNIFCLIGICNKY